MAVLLNIDAGEHPDEPEALFELAHIVNIACGGHAGDDASMAKALALCKRFGTRAGGHPSFVDRAGFGRRAMNVGIRALADAVAQQLATLSKWAARSGVTLEFVKPHGALYHAADRDAPLASAVVQAAASTLGRFTLIGPPGGALEAAATKNAIPFAREGFADRATRADGSLVPRTEPGALVTDPLAAAARGRELARSGKVDTICVHADTPGAMEIARAVRREIDASPG